MEQTLVKNDLPLDEDEYPLENYVWNFPKVPKDQSGYVQAFSIQETTEYLSFFEEFGFVVIKDVLSEEQNQRSIQEIWDEIENRAAKESTVPKTIGEALYLQAVQMEKEGRPFEAAELYMRAYRIMPELEDDEVVLRVLKKQDSKVDRDDPSTWEDDLWSGSSSHGFLGSFVATGKAAFANRQNPNVYEVFRNVIGNDNLWVAIDRYGVMRPTRGVPMGALPTKDTFRTSVALSEMEKAQLDEQSIELKDRLDWKSASSWTHWDLNPWKWVFDREDGIPYYFDDWMSENNGTRNDGIVKLQGLVTFSDCSDQEGGFCTIPGFHKAIDRWAEMTKSTRYARYSQTQYSLVKVPAEDSLHRYLEKISMRRGSLVIWRGEMAHCNFPNDSSSFRMNQYIKMFPSQDGEHGTDRRRSELLKILPQDFSLTNLGSKLFGIKSWKE